MSTIAEREAAANVKAVNRIQEDRSALLEATNRAIDRLYEIVNKHGRDIEGVTRGRITRCATALSRAIAQVENRREAREQ